MNSENDTDIDTFAAANITCSDSLARSSMILDDLNLGSLSWHAISAWRATHYLTIRVLFENMIIYQMGAGAAQQNQNIVVEGYSYLRESFHVQKEGDISGQKR